MPFNEQRLVLCCDDDPYIIQVFERTFAGQDKFILDIAVRVETACQKIRSVFYDLIFLDMNFSGISLAGMQVLETLREVELETEAKGHAVKFGHVVIMSGQVCLDDFSRKANDLDVFSFINKPVKFDPVFVKRVMRKLRPLMPIV